MRADLESAMAAVISSETASEQLMDDPAAFAREFSLSPPETAMLMEMAGDITSLTSSFVRKRRSTLRWNAHRTLDLLGEDGDEIVEEFVEASPMSSEFRVDAAAFGDFVVRRTAEWAAEEAAEEEAEDESADSTAGELAVIAAMARFERHRSDSFWHATERFDGERAADPDAADPTGDGAGPRFVAGANIGAFEWDLRLAYRHRVEPLDRLPSDPCRLLFFHSAREPVLRAVRLREREADLVERALLAGATGDVTAEVPAPPGPDGPDASTAEQLYARLSWEGALKWE